MGITTAVPRTQECITTAMVLKKGPVTAKTSGDWANLNHSVGEPFE
jgi:hypothetical protein